MHIKVFLRWIKNAPETPIADFKEVYEGHPGYLGPLTRAEVLRFLKADGQNSRSEKYAKRLPPEKRGKLYCFRRASGLGEKKFFIHNHIPDM